MADTDKDLRNRAVKSLKRKRKFTKSLVSWVFVNVLVNVIWLLTGADGSWWPGWVLLGTTIALGFEGWDAYGKSQFNLPGHGPITDEAIEAEMRKLRS